MKIETAIISNYKSFREPTTCNLSEGFNIVVGKNNVGKTALLEALSLQFQQKPHRGIHQHRGHPIDSLSLVEVNFSVSGEELKRELLNQSPRFHFPISEDNINNPGRVKNDLLAFLSEEKIYFRGERDSNDNWRFVGLPAHDIFNDLEPGKYNALFITNLRQFFLHVGQTGELHCIRHNQKRWRICG